MKTKKADESPTGEERIHIDGNSRTHLPRRTLLGLLGASGFGLLAGKSAARPGNPGSPGGAIYHWERDVDANQHALNELGALTMAGQPLITAFSGQNLTIEDGTLNVVQGHGSDLDADTLDGIHATAFAEEGHDHDDDTISPGTITTTSISSESSLEIDARAELDFTSDGILNIDGSLVQISAGTTTVDGPLVAESLHVTGEKNFVQSVETTDGPKEIFYTSVEAARSRTEISGVAWLEDGRAIVDLPEHFAMVTSATEPLVVQVTPYGSGRRLAVAERSVDRIIVKASEDGGDDCEFAYTVKGVRKGHENSSPVREP